MKRRLGGWCEMVASLGVVSCHLRVELCTGGREDRTWTREAEESSLLEAVAWERLMKHSRVEKDLAGGVVICEVWRLAIEL
jgi:hypothetical protein